MIFEGYHPGQFRSNYRLCVRMIFIYEYPYARCLKLLPPQLSESIARYPLCRRPSRTSPPGHWASLSEGGGTALAMTEGVNGCESRRRLGSPAGRAAIRRWIHFVTQRVRAGKRRAFVEHLERGRASASRERRRQCHAVPSETVHRTVSEGNG